MKAYLKFNKRRLFLFTFIIGCCLTIFISSKILLPPENTSEPLEMLQLNLETEPVFYIASQVSYTPNNIQSWITNRPELSLTANALGNTQSEPSLASHNELNLALTLTDTDIHYEPIATDLQTLTHYFSDISLSVLPSDTMTDQDYINWYKGLSDELQKKQLDSISLIAYPVTTSQLSLYNESFISCIGTVLTNQSDLESFDKVYQYFANQKPLVVRDAIKAFYKDDIQTAISDITATYHLLAVKYPVVEAIFSPCIKPCVVSDDSYAINGSDPNYYLFYTIYNRLLEKPWTTTTTKKVSTTSPYESVQDEDLIEGTVELILDPDSAVYDYIEETPVEDYSLFVSLNETYLNINTTYPYAVTIDTDKEPNGLSRLSVLIQEPDADYPTAHSVDLMIEHEVTATRSKRIEPVTTAHSSYIKPKDTYIPVLMYHTVEDTVLPEDENSHVETAIFESQMKGLLEAGFTPINFYDLKNYADGLVALPEKPIIITMDDGYLNNYTNAYPIYKKYNIQATLFVSPYYMKEENTDRHFGWTAAKEMEESGLIDIQPHGYNHTAIPYLSQKDAKYHLTHAQGMIEMHLGTRDVNVLAYPQFRHNKHTVQLLNDLGFDFQIIDLAKSGTVLASGPSFNPPKLQRINVPNTMTPEELVTTINELTAS